MLRGARDEHRRAVVGERDERGVELRVAAVERCGACGREHAAPVRVTTEECCLHERRRRDPLGDRPRLARARGAADCDLGEHRRALAVRDDLLREIGADGANAECELRVGRRRSLDRRCTRCEQHDRVVRRALAVDRDRVEGRVDRGPEEGDRLARLERIVRRDDREHRRQVGVDHPRALGHATDGEAGAAATPLPSRACRW